MKSYLVDALRQADAKSASEEGDKRPVSNADEVNASPGGSELLPLTELEISETRDVGPDDVTMVATPEMHLQADDPPATSGSNPYAATSMLKSQVTSSAQKKSILASLGRLAPVICLAAMSAAAGGYVLLNHLTTNDLNMDLKDLSERARLNGGTKADQWRSPPGEDPGFLNQIVAEDAASVKPQVVNAKSRENPAPAAQVPAAAKNSADSLQEPGGQFSVSRSAAAAVDDLAFSSVVKAYDAYRSGSYELAEEHYRHALTIEPNHSDALAGLAAVFQQTGRDRLASESFQQLLDVDPGNTLAASALISLRSSGASGDTESDLKLLLQRFPDTHYLHYSLGSFYVSQRRWADARYEFLASHRLAPGNADYSFNVAVCMEQLGEYREARKFFDAALESAGDGFNVDKKAVAEHLSAMTYQVREPR